jgi:aspartate/glutamate racemase
VAPLTAVQLAHSTASSTKSPTTQTIALIHTSPTLTPIFGALCAAEMPDVAVFHMVDESLIEDTIRDGKLRRMTMRRLLSMIDSAALSGADAVLVTCSSIAVASNLARSLPTFRSSASMKPWPRPPCAWARPSA